MAENEEEKKSKKKGFIAFFGKKGVRLTALYIALFSLSAGGAYWFTPYLNGSLNDDYAGDNSDYGTELSNTDRFMAKLTGMTGMKGVINTLSVSFPDNDGNDATKNVVSLSSGSKLLFAMPDTKNIGFHLDTVASLSTTNSDIADVSKPMLINYDNNDLYVSVLGAKYKYLSTDYEQILDDVISVLGKDSVTIGSSFYAWVETLIAGMTGNAGSMPEMSVSFTETSSTESSHSYTCTITSDGVDYPIDMTSDADFNLTSVKTSLSFGDIDVDVDISTDMNGSSIKAISSLAPEDKDSYVSVVNMNGVFKKIAGLVKSKSFDIALEGSFSYKYGKEGEKKDDSILLSGFANVDLGKEDYRAGIEVKDPNSSDYSQKVNLAYLPSDDASEKEAYLDYNGVFKASMDQITMDAMMGRISDVADSSDSSFDKSKLEKLFSFVLESDVMNDLSEGHYQSAIEAIDDLKTENDKIIASVNLKGLGFGENAKIVATIDGNGQEGSNDIKLLKIEIKNIALKETNFNAVITLDEYGAVSFDKTGYNRLDKLPDVYDQMSSLANDKKAALDIDASIKAGETNIGVSGLAQFDAEKKLGTAKISIDEPSKKHLLTTDFNETNVHMQYQDAEKTDEKGTLAKISISSVKELIDYVSSLMNNERFEKRFLSPISSSIGEVALSSTLQSIIDGKYSVIASTKILESYTFTDERSIFTINPKALGLDKSVSFAINYASTPSVDKEGELTYKVDSLELLETEINGVKAALKISLGEYDNANESALTYSEGEYNDFSSVASLAKAAINTATDFDTYHVKAEADVTLWTANIIHLDIDFVANYTESGWEYYAKLSNIPLIPAVNSQYSIFVGYTRSVELVYKNGTFYLVGNNPFGLHGYETDEDRESGTKIDWNETNSGTYGKEYLSNEENLLKFVLGDVLNVQPYYLNMISSSDGESVASLPLGSDMKLAYENVLEDVSYDADTNDYSMDLNIGAMLDADYVIKASLGAKVNDSGYLTKLGLSAFVFAGVRVDFSLNAELVEVGETLSDSLSSSISDVIATAEIGDTH